MPYTQEIGDAICEGMASGKSLRAVCRGEGMPSAATVCRWAAENPQFAEQYAHAREALADCLAEETLEIADDGRNDKHATEDGAEVVNHDHIARSRLRVDARKWFASKIAPKKYGDKLELAGDQKAPLFPVLNVNLSTRGD